MMGMKRLTTLLLAATLALFLTACNGEDTSSSNRENNGNLDSSSQAEYETIQLNETVKTQTFEFTLTNVSFSGKNSEIGANYLVEIIDSEKEFLRCDYTIHYIGKESTNSSPISMTVLYGDGYTFQNGRQYILSPDGGLKETYRYTNNSSTTQYIHFEPLTDDIYNGYGLMEVPETVEDSTAESLDILILIDGEKFLYEIR